MTINVSPIAVTPYNSLWDGITADSFYMPLHLLADPLITDDLLDSNSTLDGLPEFNLEGTVTGTGANSGWFTGVAAGDTRIHLVGNALVDAFFNTLTLEIGESLLASMWVYSPGGVFTSTQGLFGYGRVNNGNPGWKITLNNAGKITQVFSSSDGVSTATAVSAALGSTETHTLFEVTKITEASFSVNTYIDGLVTTGTIAHAGFDTQPQGLSVFSHQVLDGSMEFPVLAGVQISDIFFARTTGDQSGNIAELATRQSRMRTSLTRKWTDVL